MPPNFVHLRTQSSYSFLESALTVEKIVDSAKRNSMEAVCICDRGNLFGSLEFSMEAQKKGLHPLHGALLNLSYFPPKADKPSFCEVLLIAKNEIGYKNLLKLVGYSFTENDRSFREHITLENLRDLNEGLILSSAYSEGLTGSYLLGGDVARARESASLFKDIFGDRFYFEIHRESFKDRSPIEKAYIELALDLEIPLIATSPVLFSDPSVYEAFDALSCVSQGTTIESDHRKRPSPQSYFKSAKEMVEIFSDLPEAIENTLHLARRCHFACKTHSPILPKFGAKGLSEEKLVSLEAEKGLKSRLEKKFFHENIKEEDRAEIEKKYFERLNYELGIICEMNFAGYFLIVSDFIKWSKENGISVGPGRGSGAGSIVAWALSITDLDPIRFGLLFERFLNPERISMPDFDIDFCKDRRDEVIKYVKEKYGAARVAQITTFGKLQAKAVIKDVSRVLGLPYSYADRLTELVPFNAVNPVTLDRAIKEVEELRRAYQGKGLYNLPGNESLIKKVLSTSLILEGLHRHSSVHAAGVVISGEDLIETVPIRKDKDSDMLVVQYSMKYAEAAGLVKFDFLGLQNLTVITKCLDLLKERGIEVDFDEIGFSDTKTYEALSRGEGTGVFQFEGIGMQSTLRKVKPDRIEDIIAIGALYRPGPMENIPTYAARKHGLQEPDYIHPSLENLLKETYGVIVYQEQVLEIARIMAGYSLGAADLLRKAMGKKIKSEMEAQEKIFLEGAKKRGIGEEKAKSVFELLAKFAGYGFNKAHATAYGVISYRTGYLKANFPKEFLVACLNLELDDSDKIRLFVQEAKNKGIKILPPDINSSKGYFALEGESIIFALGAIKNVTKTFGSVVEEERKKGGPFKSVIDFAERVEPKHLNKKLFENIVKAGCFDSLEPSRNKILENLPKILSYGQTFREEKNSPQISLLNLSESGAFVLSEAPNKEYIEEALEEFDVAGMFLSKHPLDNYENILKGLGVKNSSYPKEEAPLGYSSIKIAGTLQKKDSRMSPRGRFVSLLLSDPLGMFYVTIYDEEILKSYSALLEVKKTLIVSCDIFKDEGGIKLTAKSFSSPEEITAGAQRDIKLFPKNGGDLKFLVSFLKGKVDPEGMDKIFMEKQEREGFFTKIALPGRFSLSGKDIEALSRFMERV